MDTSKLLDFLGNDRTGIYRCESYGQYPADSWDIERCLKDETKGWIYYMPELLSYGDYDNSTDVHRSNYRMFMKQFGNRKWIRYHQGGHDWHGVWIDILCDDEEVIKCLAALADYPCIDDEDCGRVQTEMEQESWDSWVQRDFTNLLEKKFGAYDSDMDADKLRDYYHELKDKTNTEYFVESGGNGYVDLKRIIEQAETKDWMKLEFDTD